MSSRCRRSSTPPLARGRASWKCRPSRRYSRGPARAARLGWAGGQPPGAFHFRRMHCTPLHRPGRCSATGSCGSGHAGPFAALRSLSALTWPAQQPASVLRVGMSVAVATLPTPHSRPTMPCRAPQSQQEEAELGRHQHEQAEPGSTTRTHPSRRRRRRHHRSPPPTAAAPR